MPATRYCRGALVAAGVCLLALSVPASSTVFLETTLDELIQDSEAIVQARVTDIQSEWFETGNVIVSYVTLDVTRTLRGNVDDQIVVRVPGGTVDGFTIRMEGAPRFLPNQNVVVFLGHWPNGDIKVNGYEMGKSHVELDQAKNEVLRGGLANGQPLSALAERVRQITPPVK